MHHQEPGQSGLKFNTSGISIGADYRFDDRLIVGAGVGYGQDKTNVGTDGTQDKATNVAGAVYGSFHPSEKTYIDGVLGYASMRFETRRYDAAAPEFEFGRRSGDEWFGSLTAAWVFKRDRLLVSPYGRIDGVSGTLDAYTEVGGIGALAFASQSVTSLKSTLGVHGDYLYPSSVGLWQPRLRIEYEHEFEGLSGFHLQYADWLSGPIYTGTLDGLGRDHLLVGVGTDLRRKSMTFSFDIKTDVDGGSETVTQIMGKLAWQF